MARTSYIRCDYTNVRFVPDQRADLNFYSVKSLTQQSVWIDISLNSRFLVNQSLLFLRDAVCLADEHQIQI